MALSVCFIAIFIMLFVNNACTNIECESNEHCECLLPYTFKCPPNNEKINMKIVPFYDVLVECKNLDNLDESIFPNITINDIISVTFENCPLQDESLTKIFTKIKITSCDTLKFNKVTNKIYLNKNSLPHFPLGESSVLIENSHIVNINANFLENYADNKYVVLSNNSISYISKDTFSNKTIQTLVLKNNKLNYIEAGTFNGLLKLENLDLSGNQLTNISSFLFKDLQNLKTLILRSNHIEKIETKAFVNLKVLKNLDLSYNTITNITRFMFKGLHKLEILTMIRCQIEYIEDGAFDDFDNLFWIDLSDNKIKLITDLMFINLNKLESAVLILNSNLTIAPNAFRNKPSLNGIMLGQCNITHLEENVFEGSENIDWIGLEDNNLVTLPNNIFKKLYKIFRVYLNNNKIKTLPSNVFSSLINLVLLDMSNNLIEELPKDIFKNLVKLSSLLLKSNKIKSVDGLFTFSPNLENLNLRNNLITQIHNTTFSNLTNLIALDLSGNRIKKMSGFPLNSLQNLFHLNMANNNMKIEEAAVLMGSGNFLDISQNDIGKICFYPVTYINMSFNNILDFKEIVDYGISPDSLYDISYNNITIFDLKTIKSIVYPNNFTLEISHNPIHCNCLNFDFFNHIKSPNNMKNNGLYVMYTNLTCQDLEHESIKIEELNPDELVCNVKLLNYSCSDTCDCYWRPYDGRLSVDCSNNQLRYLPELKIPEKIINLNSDYYISELEIDVSNNLLEKIPGFTHENLTKLILRNNKITRITDIPESVRVVDLDKNQIQRISQEEMMIIKSLGNVQNLSLTGNPWICDCETTEFKDFLINSDKIVNPENIKCINSGEAILTNKSLCFKRNLSYIIFAVIIALLVITSSCLAAVYYRNPLNVKHWLYSHNICLWLIKEEDLDKDKNYDVFLSYSNKDENYVLNTLLPILEGGTQPFTVCLHFRNWKAGEFITNNIIQSVEKSRKTLVVLSNNFVKSEWAKTEFRTAHIQALQEGKTRVLVVIYGDVDENSLDAELKVYLNTNTYLKWDDPKFEDKLRYALTHQTAFGSS